VRVLVAGWLLLGCGRANFDVTRDGATGDGDEPGSCSVTHDEDGDGVNDCADLCPHIPDPAQGNSDGDGVGDACDPGTANQALLFFSPMTETGPLPSVFQTTSGIWTSGADAWHYDGDGTTQLEVRIGVRDVDIWLGVRIDALDPGGPKHLGIVPVPTVGPSYYTELYGPVGQPAYIAISRFDGGTVQRIASTDLAAFPTGRVALRLGARAIAGQMFGQLSQPPATMAVANTFGNIPGYGECPRVLFNIDYVELDLEYIAMIETLP